MTRSSERMPDDLPLEGNNIQAHNGACLNSSTSSVQSSPQNAAHPNTPENNPGPSNAGSLNEAGTVNGAAGVPNGNGGGPRATFKLPQTLSDILKYPFFSEGNKVPFVDINDFIAKSPKEFLVHKFSIEGALTAARPLNMCMIMILGLGNSGKSTTFNKFFNKPVVTVSPVSSTKEFTRHNIPQRVTEGEVMPLTANLQFVDGINFQGTYDILSYTNALKKFKADSIDLQSRAWWDWTFQRNLRTIKGQNERRAFRMEVFPNIVLITHRLSKDRVDGNSSHFSVHLQALKQSGLIDVQRPNLIVALTAVTLGSHDQNEICSMITNLRGAIQQQVIRHLGIPNVPVIPIENTPEWGTKDSQRLPRHGEFHVLPNGEINFKNLYRAMDGCVKRNEDRIGQLLINWYFHPYR